MAVHHSIIKATTLDDVLSGDDDPMEDGVRAAVPRERDEYMLMRCSMALGDRGDTPSSADRNRVSTESRCCTFRLKKDGQVMWNNCAS